MSDVPIYRANQAEFVLKLTESAEQRLQHYLKKQPDSVGVEFTLSKTGCSGFAYKVNLLKHIPDDVLAYEVRRIPIYIPMQYRENFQGMTVDYQKDGLNEMFLFENPNEQARCGCGESITF